MHTDTRVLIVQHPDEAKHPLNTARLAALGLKNAQLWVGVTFQPLRDTINAAERAFLLFPGDGLVDPQTSVKHGTPAQRSDANRATPAQTASKSESRLLIVPDGTWRKARQIVRANPVLQALPRISFSSEEASEYRVRRAREPSALATIEAIVRALEALEPYGDFSRLLKPFNVLVEQQIDAMGPDIYQRHHARPNR